MAIPDAMIRVTLTGHLTGGEIFNSSFWVVNNAAEGAIDTEVRADAYAAAVRDQFQLELLPTLVPRITADSAYDEVRIYGYPDGGPIASVIGAASVTGGTGTGTDELPLQCATVASLRSDFSGRSRRGRMYLPMTAGLLGVDHQFTNVAAQAIADDTAAFLSAVNAIPRTFNVVVLSQLGTGSVVPVTEIVVDTRVDTQRRRAQDQAVTAITSASVSGQV